MKPRTGAVAALPPVSEPYACASSQAVGRPHANRSVKKSELARPPRGWRGEPALLVQSHGAGVTPAGPYRAPTEPSLTLT